MAKKAFTPRQVAACVKKELAKECSKRGLDLQLEVSGRRQADDLLYRMVMPTSPKFSSEDYVRVLAEVEMRVEEEFRGLQLLLVPASPEEPARAAKRPKSRRRKTGLKVKSHS